MMFEWKGKSGFGGLPHMSYIKRKPKPLGTELKSVCEGTMGICVFIEIQKGKVAMARKKFHTQFGATTACTVRLCDALNLNEAHEVPPLGKSVENAEVADENSIGVVGLYHGGCFSCLSRTNA